MTGQPSVAPNGAPIVPPNGVIGILGGGQLGRMLAQAGSRIGLRTHIFAPEAHCPAADAAAFRTTAAYEDEAALAAFAARVDAVTYEFENVPACAVQALERLGAAVAPCSRALGVAQDRLFEKDFVRSLGAETAPYRAVDDLASLHAALDDIGRPAILKTRRLGYDGKGQTRIDWAPNGPDTLAATWDAAIRKAWDELGARPSILEGCVDFLCEISVIGARGRDGAVALYDSPRNVHEGGVLRRSSVPAHVARETEDTARTVTTRLLEALGYVGVVGVEFFVLRSGGVLVNEFAPRVHNSGHWSADACLVSQFEQHMRAVAGWPLGSPERHSDASMDNLIGSDADAWLRLAGERGAALHLYGKAGALPGRKMGHVTRIAPLGSALLASHPAAD